MSDLQKDIQRLIDTPSIHKPEPRSIDDGGPAFPLPFGEHGYADWKCSGGMSMRDYFAAKAMKSLLDHYTDSWPGIEWSRQAAQKSYIVADAMLAERAKQGASQ